VTTTIAEYIPDIAGSSRLVGDEEVVGLATYLDTVGLTLRKPLNGQQLTQLAKTNRGYGDIKQMPTKFAHCSPWKWRVSIRHAKPDTLQLLTKFIDDYRIGRFDVVLDFLMQCRGDARRLAYYFYQHLCLRWHRRERGLRVRVGPNQPRCRTGLDDRCTARRGRLNLLQDDVISP
jgi:hypothetical protein